jgi:hypothetical protein
MEPVVANIEPATDTAPAVLDTTSPPDEELAVIDTGQPRTTVSPNTAENLARKAEFSKSLPIPYEKLINDFSSGREQRVRDEAAAEKNRQLSIAKQQFIITAAKNKGAALTPQEIDFTTNVFNSVTAKPETILENDYAGAFMKYLDVTQPRPSKDTKQGWDWSDTIVARASAEEPRTLASQVDLGRSLIRKQQTVLRELQDAQDAVEEQSMAGWGVDFAKRLVPGYTDVKLRGLTDSPGWSGIFRGNHFDIQAQEAYRKPDEEFDKFIHDTAAKLKRDNPALAVEWLQAMYGQSATDKLLNNVATPLEIASVPGIGKIAKGLSALKTERVVKDMVKAAANTVENPKVLVAEGAGDIAESVVQKAADNLRKDLSGKANPANTALEGLQSIFKAGREGIESAPGGVLNREGVNRLLEHSATLESKLIETLQRNVRVERMPAVIATENAIRKEFDTIIDKYPGLKNTVVDVSLRRDPLTSNHYADYFLGESGTKAFTREKTAQQFIKNQQLPDATIEPRGAGFLVKLSKPIAENGDVRDALLATKQTKTPDSWLNAWGGGYLGGLRTPEETLSLEQNMARKVATYGPSNLFKLARETADEVKKLSSYTFPFTKKRQMWQEWEDIVNRSKAAPHPTTGETGKMLDSPGQVEHFYLQQLNRSPSAQEISAYFAYKNMEELQEALVNLRAMTNDLRLGNESHTISTLDEARGTARSAPFIKASFNGKRQPEFPSGDASVLFVGENTWQSTVRSAKNVKGNFGKNWREAVSKGEAVVIKVANSSEKPLAGFLDKLVTTQPEYVVVKNTSLESKALPWPGLKRPADYDYDHYVAQARMRKDSASGLWHYHGDNNIAGISIRAMGKDWAERLNNVRTLLKEDLLNPVRAKAYLDANPIGVEFDTVYKWFKHEVSTEGLPIPARLSLEDPIHVVPKHRMVKDMYDLKGQYKDKFRDDTIQGYGKMAKSDPYDVFTFRNEGTKSNPLYQIEPAKYLDPITSINRALTKAINSTFMDDYKIFSIEHWIREAKPFLRASEYDLNNAPFHQFYTAGDKSAWKNVSGDDVMRVNNLKTARLQIQQFIGVPSATDTYLQALGQKLSDSIYEKFGPKSALIPTWILPKTHDPIGFIRSMTFHAKLGLFSVPQLWVQAQTFTTIWGIAGPKFAAPGTKAALLHTWTRINRNPEILDAMDRLAQKQIIPGTSRYKPGEWKEAYDTLNRTGFENVANEYALRDNPWKYDIISSGRQQFLDAGTWFFRNGEKSVRLGAWYTAMKEFRDANPTGRLTDANIRTVLQRADLLYTNMSRASSSTLHSGVMSLPTQFLAYPIRVAELFMGKRLTQLERARLFGTYAVVYGVPGAFGLSGLPVGDFIRKWSIEDGYNVGANYINSAMTEGLPSIILHAITGNWYNFQERYGVQGLDFIRDALRSDRTMWDIVGGAGFSTLADTWDNASGLYNVMGSWVRRDGKHFPLKAQDFVDFFKGASVVNNTDKLITAANTGKWMSKKENYLADTSVANAIFMYISGLSPLGMSDMQIMRWTKREEKDFQARTSDFAQTQLKRGWAAVDRKDYAQAHDYFTRGLTALEASGFPREEMGKVMSQAAKNNETLLSRLKWNYWTDKVPETRKEIARKQAKESLKLGE